MKEEKEKKVKRREKALDAIYMMVGCLVVIVVAIYAINFGANSISKDPSEWGVFGDFFGGVLNPIFAFFSFALLLLNLHLQRQQLDKSEEQLELNREELKLTREELKKAADAQVDSAKVMNEQLKTQFLQQFDSSFFSILDRLIILLNNVEQDESIEIKLDNLNQDLYSATLTSELGYKKGNFISLIYLLLKNVKGKLDKTDYFLENEIIDLKQNYYSILRSCLSDQILVLLVRDFVWDSELYERDLLISCEKVTLMFKTNSEKSGYIIKYKNYELTDFELNYTTLSLDFYSKDEQKPNAEIYIRFKDDEGFSIVDVQALEYISKHHIEI